MSDLRARRLASGISGSVLCAKVGISRSRLSLIERGFVHPPPEELTRIENGLDQLIQTKSLIDSVAASLGWPAGVSHDK
jgi:transcriptional regulator with XRE-family HTH domain